ncbi:3'-5' exoribonuclease HELZ2-like [Mytilus galloprovincialis]|uniref:3'-5' exoribonuclease HELZ2-like n=1 Tax=Mytilus galloprovincialis TaxID=29158 RepID=UPI003F7B4C8B
MDSDSDDEWYDEEANQSRNRLRNMDLQQGANTESLHDTPESWFHEGLEINRYEFIRTENVCVLRPFLYRDIFSAFDENKLTKQPDMYKRCMIKILSMEEAVCFPEENKHMKINISGRENCGQTYTDDVVYVKISNKGEPQEDKKYYGEVVSFIDRNRFKNISHPVFVCLIDRRQSHLMIPICKTIPKINILHGRLAKKYPERLRTSVEIHKHDSATNDLKFHKYHNITEGDKENWLFIVVLLKWKLTNIHPLGAVLGVVHSSKDIEEGLTLISYQNNLPLWFDYPSVDEIKELRDDLQAPGYQDITKTDKIFTIAGIEESFINHGFSIRKMTKNRVRVGIHVTDVSKVVHKDDDLDIHARSRGFSFHSSNTAHNKLMLPDHINNLCSLEPGRRRYAISVFFDIDQTEPSNIHVTEKTISRTVMRSSAHYNYIEVENIINNQDIIDDIFADDIKILFLLSKKLKFQRLQMESFTSPISVDFTTTDGIMKTKKAHSLVEEYLVLANNTIGSILTQNFPMNVPVFHPLQMARDSKNKQREWYFLHKYFAHLLCSKQEEIIEEKGKLSLVNALPSPYYLYHRLADPSSMSENDEDVNIDIEKRLFVPIQSNVLDQIVRNVQIDRTIDEAIELICSDFVHPKQGLALKEWQSFEPSHQYRMSVLHRENPAVQFTCPLSRYCDIIIHRLIHAYLDEKNTPYDFTELRTICAYLNTLLKKTNDFNLQYKELVFSNYLKQQPIIFQGFVSHVSREKYDIFIPGLQDTMTKSVFVKFSEIDVCSIPEITLDNDMVTFNERTVITGDPENIEGNEDTHQIFSKVTVKWRRRLYSFKATVLEKPMDDEVQRPEKHVKIYPHQNTTFISLRFWKSTLQHVFDENRNALKNKMSNNNREQMMQELERNKQHIDSFKNSVTDVSSEVSDQVIIDHFVPFQTSFRHGQIVTVQMSAQELSGILTPIPQIAILTNGIKFCLPHVQDPIKTFLRYAKKSSLPKYRNVDEYKNIWLPVVEMESTYNAVHGEESVIINEVPLVFKNNQGMFEFEEEFCEKRDLEFGYIPEVNDNEGGSLINENKTYFPLPSGNFLCIMKDQDLDLETKQMIGNQILHKDKYIWSAHAETTKICKYQKLEQRRNGCQRRITKIRVAFQLHENSSPPPATSLDDCRLEIISKSPVDRRLENHLKKLRHGTDLAKNIALRKEINFPDRIHLEVAEQIETEGLDVDMWPNNQHQHWAIKTSLKRRFKLIQGPPGTGKTYIGVKLVYLFNKFNTLMQQRTGDTKNQIIFCGPSNRSVDLVARLVIEKLGPKAPRIVRIYGSAIEQLSFPIPGRASVTRRNISDAKADPYLVEHGVVLHYLIRQEGKPYAERIKELDNQFSYDVNMLEEINERDREPLKTTIKEIKEYKDIQSKATKEELPQYDVIFCTNSLVANPKVLKATKDKVYQLIIDESGMCSEPSTIVPIIATMAKQVVLIGDHKQLRPIIKCKEAAKLGLETSLFERYSENILYKTMLKEQYRMHPKICEFPSKHFYDGELKTHPGVGTSHQPLQMWPRTMADHWPHVFCHVEGDEEMLTVKTEAGNEQSRFNEAEVKQVMKVFQHMVENENVPPSSINVMSQYNAQCTALREESVNTGLTMPIVSTVVASQGGEWDYVIFSLVRSIPSYRIPEQPTRGWCLQNLGFITDKNQINVALTRAKKGLVIIGNRNLLVCDPVWKDLIHDYEKKNCMFIGTVFPPVP